MFIKISKDGVTIDVHPDVLEEHVNRLGWKVVEPELPVEELPAVSVETPEISLPVTPIPLQAGEVKKVRGRK